MNEKKQYIRDKFWFQEKWYRVLEKLNDTEFLFAFDSILEFAFFGTPFDYEKTTETVKVVFKMVEQEDIDVE